MKMLTVDRLPTLSLEHAGWLEARSVSSELAAREGWHSIGQHLGVPYFHNGKLQFTKYRSLDKTHFRIEPTGARLCLLNLDGLRDPSLDSRAVIITEGELDYLAVKTIGINAVTSVPAGAPAKLGKGRISPDEDTAFSYLWGADGKLLPELERFREFVLAVDDDQAGHNLRDALAVRLGRMRCRVVTYPEGCKDANDTLQRFGADALRQALRRPRPFVPNELVGYWDIPDRAYEVYTTAWSGLDDHIRISPPEMVIITGPPGSGKSQFALNIGMDLARLYGLPGAVLQLEDEPRKNRDAIMGYAMRYKCGLPRGVDGVHHDASMAVTWMQRMIKTSAPPEETADDRSLAWLAQMIEEAVVRHGARWIIIDPWNEIEHTRNKGETESDYANDVLRQFRLMTRRFNISLLICAHPSKEAGQVTDINKASLYGVAGAAAWNNKADQGFIVMRPDKSGRMALVKKDKAKDAKRTGRVGTFMFSYDEDASEYTFTGHYESGGNST